METQPDWKLTKHERRGETKRKEGQIGKIEVASRDEIASMTRHEFPRDLLSRDLRNSIDITPLLDARRDYRFTRRQRHTVFHHRGRDAF